MAYQRGQITTYQQRLEILELSKQGQKDREIAQQLGCSIYTIRKWRRIATTKGHMALAPQKGRPPAGALSKLDPLLKTYIYQLRKAHPGWGPTTLLIELGRDHRWHGYQLPSRSRLAAYLKENKLTRGYLRHWNLAQPKPTQLVEPHQEWELDAAGSQLVAGVGKVSLINIIDKVSRLKIESYPTSKAKPALEDYRLALRRAFVSYGLPKSISLDHDTVFYDPSSPSPFPTRLHLWLVGLGIEVKFIRIARPTDHATIERNHQTLSWQALEGQHYSSKQDLWEGLDQRRQVINHYLPVKALGRQAALTAYPGATHSGRIYQPKLEAELFSMERVYTYLARGRWFRRVRGNQCFMLHHHNYWLGKQSGGQELEITFQPEDQTLKCQWVGTNKSIRLPIANLSKADLMGELAALQALPAYQLALPLSGQDWRKLTYTQNWAA